MQKIGILGGGQLGRLLLQAAINYPVETYILEDDPNCPAGHLCHHFIKGDFKNFENVYAFGKGLDAITIEIESVNADALQKLKDEGVRVYPDPATLKTIQNKILQKEFYAKHNIPTAEFITTTTQSELNEHIEFLPAIHKLAEGGFDGRGVVDITNASLISQGFNEPAVLEKKINISKEISVIIGVNDSGGTSTFPPVEMIFDTQLNVLNYQLSPADLDLQALLDIKAIANNVVNNLKSPGIFAVEMFIDTEGRILVNETAVRVHNSGHHTIEANYISQFDMLWRIMLGLPMDNLQAVMPSAMINIIGETMEANDINKMRSILKVENTFIHIYGKNAGRAGRKMGHVTILHTERDTLIKNVQRVREILKSKSE